MSKNVYFISHIVLMFITISIGIRHEGYLMDTNRGIFRTFLKNYLNLLSNGCSGKQLITHLKIMQKELNNVDYKYARDLAKVYKDLSKLYTDLIREEVNVYFKELERETNRRLEFFRAFDEAFHAREVMLFQNYVEDLSDYCKKQKISIKEESHKLLHEVILYGVEKLSRKKKKELKKKLRKAMKEYSDIDLYEKIKLYNITSPPRWHSLAKDEASK